MGAGGNGVSIELDELEELEVAALDVPEELAERDSSIEKKPIVS